jgi:hypothetical protein
LIFGFFSEAAEFAVSAAGLFMVTVSSSPTASPGPEDAVRFPALRFDALALPLLLFPPPPFLAFFLASLLELIATKIVKLCVFQN